MKNRNRKSVAVFLAIFFLLCGCTDEAAVTITSANGEVFAGEVLTEPAEDGAPGTASPVTVQGDKEDLGDQETDRLLIHICGAVFNPGVYELTEGDRICHAVDKAGGFTQQADENYLNQAQKLTDGMRIYIPTKDETAQMAESNLPKAGDLMQMQENESGLININTATLEQLCSLPGIGEGKAQNIIAYRTKNGSYASIEEIMNVEGIKEGLFEKIRDRITVS